MAKKFILSAEEQAVLDAVAHASYGRLEPSMELVLEYNPVKVDDAIKYLEALREHTTYIEMSVHSNFILSDQKGE